MAAKKEGVGLAGGSGDEAGGQYRRALAVLLVAYGLRGLPFLGLPGRSEDAHVLRVGLEADFPVDDIAVTLSGGRLFIQSKRTLQFGRPMNEVVPQWLRAVRHPDFQKDRDWLAAAGGDVRGSVVPLMKALDRRRQGATRFSAAESRALGMLRRLLQRAGADSAEVELVLKRALILHLQVEDAGDAHAEVARLLLDTHVTLSGEGARAWRELILLVSNAARANLDLPIEHWLDRLEVSQVPLTRDSAASRSAYLLSRKDAVARYRKRLQHRGDHVDLTAIGLALPLLPLAKMDAKLVVSRPGSERERHDLLWTFLRLGRALLTGLPGGGKSTAIAALIADWSRQSWSLPIAASLRRLGEKERFRRKPLRDEILDLAVEPLDPQDRPLVRDALDEALGSGRAALFLDGLDEAADRSVELASDVAQLIASIHPDTDVLLGTRDDTYAGRGARILSFAELRLGAPTESMRAVEAVLRAVAEHRHVAEPHAWISARVEWVRRSLRLDRQLSETPLMPVLLASLAADRDRGALPRTRSLILREVIENVVHQWELKREVKISGFPAGHEGAAVFGTFPVIASLLQRAGGSAPRATLSTSLATHLQSEWHLAPAVARATAHQVLAFWDISGIFIARTGDRVVEPRLRLFLEIGTALDLAARSPEEIAAWVERQAPDRNAREMLILAAGSSEVAADVMITLASDGTHDWQDALALAAAAAFEQGGTIGLASLRKLVHRLIALMGSENPTSKQALWTLVRLNVPGDLQQLVVDQLQAHFPPNYVTVATALASLEWQWEAERRDPLLERSLYAGPLEPLQQPRKQDGPRRLTAARAFENRTVADVKTRAARILLPARPDLAPAVAAAAEGSSFETLATLRELLRRHGHVEIEAAIKNPWIVSAETAAEMGAPFVQLDKSFDDVLQVIATSAAPSKLTLSQERRLRELALFFDTANLIEIAPWMSRHTWMRNGREWCALVCQLIGVDARIIAAEAQILREDLARDKIGQHMRFSAC